jgi:hypothetical protein
MAAIAGISPRSLHDILLRNGWTVIDETENVWLFVDGNAPKSEPVPVPKHGDVVDPEVMDSVCHHSPGLTQAVMGIGRAPSKPASVPPPKP